MSVCPVRVGRSDDPACNRSARARTALHYHLLPPTLRELGPDEARKTSLALPAENGTMNRKGRVG
jgi:hypothetical protein